VVVVLFVSTTVPVQANTVGVSAGDSMVFKFTMESTYKSPNGNITSVTTAQEQISVQSVNTSTSLGEFGYALTVNSVNSTTQTSITPVSNFSTIFDPYNNLTYAGNLGFWPIVYTDVKGGAMSNLEVNETYNVNGTLQYSADVFFNFTVARRGGLIGVNMTMLPTLGGTTVHSIFRMSFNAATGVLENFTDYANIPPIEEILSYNLVSFTIAKAPDFAILLYIVVGAIVVVAAVEVARRKSPSEKRNAKMREKFKGGH
jgi:hypothetical protein